MKFLFRRIGILLGFLGIFGFLNITSAGTLSASGQTIILAPGWNTFSTPKVLENINFQSGGTGLYFYTLTSTGWQTVTPTTSTIKPLEGFMVNNANTTNSQVELTYKDNLSPMEMIFQKSLHAGWNILGITTTSNPFSSLGTNTSMGVDFSRTNGGGQNYVNKVASSFYTTTGNNLSAFTLGESYGLFLQSGLLYGAVQNQNISADYIPETVSISLSGGNIIPGKTAQTILQVRVTAGDQDITLSGFTLSRSGSTGFLSRLANVKLYRNGVSIGNVTLSNDNIIISGLSSYTIDANNTQTYELRADTLIDMNNTSLGFLIQNTSDIQVQEVATELESIISINEPSGVVVDFIQTEITLSKNTTHSVVIAPGTSNIVLFDANITSSTSFDVTQFALSPVGSSTPTTDASEMGAYNNLTFTVNGVDYDLLSTTFNSGSTYVFNKASDKFRIDPGSPTRVKLTGNFSNIANTGAYSYRLSIDTLKTISIGNEVTGLNKDITGDNVTVSTPSLLVKAPTIAAPSNSKIYSNASSLEIGRFSLQADVDEITVREITLTNSGNVAGTFTGVTDFTKLVSGTNVKLINVADGSQASATVTVNTSDIKLTGMSVKVAKDTTSNFKVLVDTQGDLTTYAPGNIALNVDVVNATSSSASSINPAAFQTAKVYTVSVIPPTVTLVKKSANVFLVTITNTDSDTGITLNSITAQVRPVSVANNNYSTTTCLRDEGSSDKCDVAPVTGSVPGSAQEFVITGGVSISKNSSITREIFVDSNYVSPSDLQGEVTAIKYNTSVSEAYSVIAQ